MSNIDKQALREAAEGNVKYAQMFINPRDVLALLGELEKLQQANASQDDHINQQEDRVESLEKKNSDLGKALGKSEKHISELETRGFSSAVSDVLAERRRQVTVEGWSPEHDDLHDSGELAGAAACYAHYTNARGWVFPTNPGDYQSADEPNNWPWDPAWWKPTNPRRDLVKAGALILAEIERIDRAAGIGKGE